MNVRELVGWVLFAAMLPAGILVLAAGEDVALGLLLTLSGGSVLLFAVAPLVRSRGPAVRIATLDGEPSFVLDTARGRELVIQVALFGLTAGAVAMAATGSLRSWLALVVLVPVTGWWSWRAIRGGRAITLTPTRVVLTVDGREELAWDEVELDPDDLDEFVASADQIERLVALYRSDRARRAAIGTETELALAARLTGAARPGGR
jgi:hypothetical protein